MTDDPNPIDARHCNWLRSILLSGHFKRVCEIGSHKGFSTTAFLDALGAGTVEEVHICEPHPQRELLNLIDGHSKRNRIKLHRCNSVDFLDSDTNFDFLFLDSDHREEVTLAELERLLPANLLCVAAHDTGSYGRYPQCDGPMHLKAVYQAEAYSCIEDSLYRKGERTERALFVACRTPEVYASVLEGYRSHCQS